jgi:Probable sensor domain DACNG/Probable sensor domain DACNH/DisA bacterial checkpoint controller nucleotide-binding
MPKVTTQFMWTYQNVFRSTVARQANFLFNEIGWEEKAQVFVLGVRASDCPGPNPVCLEPEDDKWSFNPFANLATEVWAAVPKHRLQSMVFDERAAMREKPENIRCQVVCEEVQRVMSQLDSLGDTASFVGPARRVNDYYVVAVLQVPKTELTDLPALVLSNNQGPQAYSFVHACIRQVLLQAWDILGTREPGRSQISHQLLPRELAARAASDLLNTITAITAGPGQGVSLFTVLNEISGQMYERQESVGGIILASRESNDIEYILKLDTKVPLREVRWSRKLIQLACDEAKLICNGVSIFGVGRWKSDPGSSIEIELFGRRSWTLKQGTEELLRAHFGDPKIPKKAISEQRFLENFGMLFPQSSTAVGQQLWKALETMESFDYGSLLIVSIDAAKEAIRLREQGTIIVPTPLSTSLLESASRIDGAILVDADGICHAIGVIVDGASNQLGSPSRGDRYNAAHRYVLVTDTNRMAIVRSDDRTLDVIPLLPKRVSRTAVERMIQKLETATLDNHIEYRSFLESHRFYLDHEQCRRVNSALEKIHKEPREWNKIVLPFALFEPHPGMNPIFWLD